MAATLARARAAFRTAPRTGVVQCTWSTPGRADAVAFARCSRRLRTGRGAAPTRPRSAYSIVWYGLD